MKETELNPHEILLLKSAGVRHVAELVRKSASAVPADKGQGQVKKAGEDLIGATVDTLVSAKLVGAEQAELKKKAYAEDPALCYNDLAVLVKRAAERENLLSSLNSEVLQLRAQIAASNGSPDEMSKSASQEDKTDPVTAARLRQVAEFSKIRRGE